MSTAQQQIKILKEKLMPDSNFEPSIMGEQESQMSKKASVS